MCDVRQAIEDFGKLMPELAEEEAYAEYYRTYINICDLVDSHQKGLNLSTLGDATVEVMKAVLDRHRIIDGRKVIDRSKQKIAAAQNDDSIAPDRVNGVTESHLHICSDTESKIEHFTRSEQQHRKRARALIQQARQVA